MITTFDAICEEAAKHSHTVMGPRDEIVEKGQINGIDDQDFKDAKILIGTDVLNRAYISCKTNNGIITVFKRYPQEGSKLFVGTNQFKGNMSRSKFSDLYQLVIGKPVEIQEQKIELT